MPKKNETMMDDFVAALVNVRQDVALSQNQLAQRSGVSQSLISKIESRKRDPQLSTVLRMIEGMGARVVIEVID